MVSLLFSYSHKDEEMRDRLEIQLATLKRQGFIQTWHDRRIGAGEDFVNEIDNPYRECRHNFTSCESRFHCLRLLL